MLRPPAASLQIAISRDSVDREGSDFYIRRDAPRDRQLRLLYLQPRPILR